MPDLASVSGVMLNIPLMGIFAGAQSGPKFVKLIAGGLGYFLIDAK
jgi:hypothetical protein